MAVFMAVLNPGDKFLGLNLSHGGHLSHGSPVNFSGLMFQPLEYGVKEDTGYVDYDMMEEVALRERPKLLIVVPPLTPANGIMHVCVKLPMKSELSS